MKKDEVLNEFIENILNDNINIEEFVRYIKHYSKFIAYINSEYKYNGTFLNQYTSVPLNFNPLNHLGVIPNILVGVDVSEYGINPFVIEYSV